MLKNKLPLFYFPTRVCFVDDDIDFLNTLNQLLSRDFECDLFQNPEYFLTAMKNHQSVLSNIKLIRANSDSEEYDRLQQLPIQLDISKIEALSKNSKRSREVSVLIIDQHMPTTSGLAICEKLKNSPIKKILLTGFATETQIIDAFNDGFIHKFIAKEDPHLLQKLFEYIRELNDDYFYDYSKPLLKNLEADHITALRDPVLIDCVKQHCAQHRIKEFYLINKQGSFLMIDEKNEESYFIVMSQKDIDYFIEHHATPNDSIQTELFRRMKRGELIPFFGSHQTYTDVAPKQLRSYFYPARLLQGNNIYFYAIIKQPRLRIVP